MKGIKLLTFALGALAMASCSSTKEIVYLQDMVPGFGYKTQGINDLTVQPGDKLRISVASKNPELAIPFNASAVAVSSDGTVTPTETGNDYRVDPSPKFQVFPNIIKLGASNTAISDSDTRTIADLVQVTGKSTAATVAANLQTLYDTFIKGKLTTEQQAQGWRIPNQRELMLLYRYGYLTDNDSTNPLRFYLSCTYYTHNPSSYPSRTHDQIMDDKTALGYPKSRPFTTINGLMSLNDYGPHWAGDADVYVVLVRDAD